jgi:uncharacterized RDD family membrane protein YckC
VGLESRLGLRLPEGAGIDLPIAGIASRAVAAAVDLAIAIAFILAVTASSLNGRSLADWWRGSAAAVLVLGSLVAFPLAFEVLTGGTTPGKSMVGLRVVAADGGLLTGRALVVRNLLRVVDGLPFPYGVGLGAALVTGRSQRLGDIAAGTVVIHARALDHAALAPPKARVLEWAASVAAPGVVVDPRIWDTAGLDAADMRMVRRFLERRDGLPVAVRGWTADEVARRVRPKVVGAPAGLPAEALLEGVVLGSRPGPAGSG